MPITPDPILAAAREEFAQHGYARAGMANIARRAGIAVGSLYNSFSSKKDLFTEVYLIENREAKAALLAEMDWSEPRQAITQWVAATIATARDNRILAEWFGDALGVHLRAAAAAEFSCGLLEPALASRISEWRARGLVADEVSDELLEELYLAMTTLDRSGAVSSRAVEFLMTALLEKIFPSAG
ncbi:TetR/AcrR family transcriptional regulator [Arachnia propionica]|uniref:TetR/AcrR family transcriptional regulator n=1 Tax=Arachnia propionica TaxID=1750 RepID=A0A3P1TBR7_9ACTN|nr:TetR/AcrR family transcriptional regulator [Arachnia propionica]RRD06655.1 TetR/AcrR family transcriptional regulator [Arachnia propionica]